MNKTINLYNIGKKSVFFIYNLDDNQKLYPMGTGFIIQFPIESDPKNAAGYMVTARHVLMDNNNTLIKKFVIRINSKDKKFQFLQIDLEKLDYFLSNDNVDLIIIPHYPEMELHDFTFITGDMLLDEQLDGLGEGTEVFFPGLFVQYPGEEEPSPILRFGRLSMIPREKIRIEIEGKIKHSYFYLIECTSFSGNSGSPVFLKENTLSEQRILLCGLITGSYHQSEILPYNTILKQNTGIAAVTPSYQLLELLKSKPVYEKRQNAPYSPR